MKINGVEYQMIPEMDLGTFIELSEFFEEMEQDSLTLVSIKKFAADSRRLKRFVCLALEPVDPIDYDKWNDLRKITLDKLVDVISDFFDLGGPLQNAFPPVSRAMTPPQSSTITSESGKVP